MRKNAHHEFLTKLAHAKRQAADPASSTLSRRRRPRPTSSSPAAGDASSTSTTKRRRPRPSTSTSVEDSSSSDLLSSQSISSTMLASSTIASSSTSSSSSQTTSALTASSSLGVASPAADATQTHSLSAQRIAIGAIAGTVAALIIAGCLFIYCLKRRRRQREQDAQDPFESVHQGTSQPGEMVQGRSPSLAYENRPVSLFNNIQQTLNQDGARGLSPIHEVYSRGPTPVSDPFRDGFGIGATTLSTSLNHSRAASPNVQMQYDRRGSAIEALDASLPPSHRLSYGQPYGGSNQRFSDQSYRLSTTTGLSKDLRY